VADVQNIITLGIGSAPGKLLWFLTGGLEGAAAAPYAGPGIVMVAPYETRTMTAPFETRTMTAPAESRTMTVPRPRELE
jgi:hypothetical protein